MEFTLKLTSKCDDEARKAIFDPLVEYNKAAVGDAEYIPLNVLVLEENEAAVGGLWGHTAWGWFVIELLFLPVQLRGQGVASSILRKAEAEAVDRDCWNSWVDTHEFQARGFYETNGYTLFGELPDYPKGYARYFLRKSLRGQ